MRVIINGVAGNMGRELVKAIAKESDIKICGACDIIASGADIGNISGIDSMGIQIESDIFELITHRDFDVLVDFTNPKALDSHLEQILKVGICLVIGTSGITAEKIEKIKKWCTDYGSKVIVAPNFAIGAVLMMKFANLAAKYLPSAEIIEMHHDRKLDAPSGTAIRTAELISLGRGADDALKKPDVELVARGECIAGVPVHSVRLPGLVAHQEVVFGSLGQTLTIRHDSLNRESFMPGVLLAIRKVPVIDGVVYGLENLL